MQTVAKTLVQHLKKWHITHVFGIPGKPVTPLILEMDRNGITFVLCKHECGAGFAAAGYAMAKRTLGVALGTAGPGGTNMLTAAGQAKATNTPVLFLTGQPPIKEIGKVLGQDSTMFGTDLVRMFEPVTKFSARVERSDLMEVYFKHAVEQACTGVPGPVHLSIPLDVLFEEGPAFQLDMPTHATQLISSNLDEVIEMLNAARRPVILAGIGVHAAQAYTELEAFAEQWSIPVMTTPGGKGTFRSRHPLSLGPLGLGGNLETEAYMQDRIDVLLVLGSQLSDLEVPGLNPAVYPRTLIHFEHEPRFIGKAIDVPTISVLGNLKANLQAILRRGRESGASRTVSLPAPQRESEVRPTESDYMSGRQVMQTLREELPGDAIMFGDAGSHSFYAIKHYEIEEPGTFFFEEVFASMGRAIGYSVGAQIAQPDKVIVCLTGDGCMFMNGTEVSTAANHGVPVLFIVFNNGSLDMVDKGMARHLGRSVGTVYAPRLDAARFGEAMGAAAYRCETESELRQAVATALRERRTAVIDVIVDPHEIPPTMKRG